MTFDETPLEALLRESAAEPDRLPAFYRILLDSWVLLPTGQNPPPDSTSECPVPIPVRTVEGRSVIPFFSSECTLRLAFSVEPVCAAIVVRDLFRLAPYSIHHLNPTSEFGRMFTPDEVSALLSGDATVAHVIPSCDCARLPSQR
ncbi:MAG TPA: SseB family protein [Acidobacteriaceae bacterium]|nr:SseB family protein [Acidobacteriaceae bacterium]